MKIIDPDTGWLEIVKFPCFNLKKVAKGGIEYIDKSYSRVIHMFNHKFYSGTHVHIK